MKKKFTAILITIVMILSLAACGAGEETTVTGMVVSIDGTVLSVIENDGSTGENGFAGGERPEMPEGMENFESFGNFNPEDFEGNFPEGERPEMPEGMENFEGFGNFDPENFDGTFPEGERPEMPEGITIPEDGNRPEFNSENGERPNFGNFDFNAETKDIDIGNAHISVEIDGGKASGTIDDITAGSFVTITMNAKGEVTNVLVSSRSGFSFGNGSSN